MPAMIRIAITAAAFDAIAAPLPLGSVSFERHPADDGQRLVWLDRSVVAHLRALRRPGESYSDVILRLGKIEAKRAASACAATERGMGAQMGHVRSESTRAKRTGRA
jgi:hypothetical protein